MNNPRRVGWALAPLALVLAGAAGWFVFQPVHAKGRHGEGHGHRQLQEEAGPARHSGLVRLIAAHPRRARLGLIKGCLSRRSATKPVGSQK